MMQAAGLGCAQDLCLVGGGSKNTLWGQVLADAFQLPVRYADGKKSNEVLKSEWGRSLVFIICTAYVLLMYAFSSSTLFAPENPSAYLNILNIIRLQDL